MTCDHSGTYSGASRYVRDAGVLRLVLLCDRCGAERQELGTVEYRPDVNVPGLEQARLGAAKALGGTTAAPAWRKAA
jgi:hypothetical protein